MELEGALQKLSLSKSEMGQHQNKTHVQHRATLTSMQVQYCVYVLWEGLVAWLYFDVSRNAKV